MKIELQRATIADGKIIILTYYISTIILYLLLH